MFFSRFNFFFFAIDIRVKLLGGEENTSSSLALDAMASIHLDLGDKQRAFEMNERAYSRDNGKINQTKSYLFNL